VTAVLQDGDGYSNGGDGCGWWRRMATATTVTAVGGSDGDGCGRQLVLVGDHGVWLLLQDGDGYSNDGDSCVTRQ
jgi:hypothetical protein